MPTAGNLTWSCLKIDNYKLSVTTYEKIKNTLSLKIQREAGLFGTKLFKLVNVMTKAISIKPTGIFQDWMASDTNSNENYSGYLFNNGYFDLLRLQFREQKQNCWKSFDYDFNTEYDEKIYPEFNNFYNNFKNIYSEDIIYGIFGTLMDYASDSRFMIILESAKGNGKSTLIDFFCKIIYTISSY